MGASLIVMGIIGSLSLLLSLFSFVGAKHKIASFELALALVTKAYSLEETDSDGDRVTRYYNELSIRNRSWQELSTMTVSGKHKPDEQYLILYDPTTGPQKATNTLKLSLSAIWLGPLLLLFVGVLLTSLSLLMFAFG